MEDILILGAGRVGSEIASALVNDKFNVTIVDVNANRLLALQSKHDLRTVRGNAGDPAVLREAGVEDASIVVAVTAIDEVNLVACKVCSALSENIKKIARVRSWHYDNDLVRKEFGVDVSFCPEQKVAESFSNAIAHPGCLSVHRFTDERLALAGIRISSKSDIAGSTIADLRRQIVELEYRIVSIYRDGDYLLPEADTRLFVGDDVYILAQVGDLDELTPYLAGEQNKNKHIFIAGGGGIGERVALQFDEEEDVKVIEVNRDRCRELSSILPRSLILKGSATDESLLEQENIKQTDIFCSLTNDDEENILSAMLAKRLGAKKIAVLINRVAYVDILQRQLDVVVSPAQVTIGSVLSAIRAGNFNAVHSLRYGTAEAVEFTVRGDAQTSKLTGCEAQQIEWPEGTVPGAILRAVPAEENGNKKNGNGGDEDKERAIIIVHDTTVVEEGDHVICFVSNRDVVRQMEKFIQVGLAYTGDATG